MVDVEHTYWVFSNPKIPRRKGFLSHNFRKKFVDAFQLDIFIEIIPNSNGAPDPQDGTILYFHSLFESKSFPSTFDEMHHIFKSYICIFSI